MDDVTLAELAEKHHAGMNLHDFGSDTTLDFCKGCGNAYPCDSARLIEEVRRLREALQHA